LSRAQTHCALGAVVEWNAKLFLTLRAYRVYASICIAPNHIKLRDINIQQK